MALSVRLGLTCVTRSGFQGQGTILVADGLVASSQSCPGHEVESATTQDPQRARRRHQDQGPVTTYPWLRPHLLAISILGAARAVKAKACHLSPRICGLSLPQSLGCDLDTFASFGPLAGKVEMLFTYTIGMELCPSHAGELAGVTSFLSRHADVGLARTSDTPQL